MISKSRIPALGLTVFLLAAPVVAAPAGDVSKSHRERYAACTSLAVAEPLKAETMARAWQDEDGGLPAGYCLALALAGQSQFGEAAHTLTEVADQMRLGGYFFFAEERADRELLGEIFGQAGNAWILAGEPLKAYESLTEAVGITPAWSDTIIEHWIDRSRALAMLGNYEQALHDLKAAQERDPDRIETYVFRANAFRKLEKFDLAAVEIEGAFRLSEEHQEALLERGILRQQTGDSEGAMQDWIKLLRRHPDSAAALVAQANLKAMNVDIGEWTGVDEVDVTGKKRRTKRQPR